MFHSTLFCYVNEKKKSIPGRGHCLSGVCSSPRVCVGLVQVLWFPPRSQRHARRVNWHVRGVPIRVSVALWGSGTGVEGHSVWGWFPRCALSYQDGLPPPRTLNWNNWVVKEVFYLLILLSLKCIYNSHLFQCLIQEAIWVIIQKFCNDFVTSIMLQKLNSYLSISLW